MTVFLRLLAEQDKGAGLATACARLRQDETDPRLFEVAPEAFDAVPGKPFAYWASDVVRAFYVRLSRLESDTRRVSLGLSTKHDVRFVRVYWEVPSNSIARSKKWFPYANGGTFSKFYYDYPAIVLGTDDFKELRAYIAKKFPYLAGNTSWVLHDENNYTDAVIAWPLRTHAFSPHYLPEGFVFSARTYAASTAKGELSSLLGLMASASCDFLLKLSLGRSGHPEFVTNVVRNLPLPEMRGQAENLTALARRAWSLRRSLDTVNETSHAFLLPAGLRRKECTTEDTEITEVEEGNKEPNKTLPISVSSVSSVVNLFQFDPPAIEAELSRIQSEIDAIAFDLYGFSEADRLAALNREELTTEDTEITEEEEKEIEFSVSSVVNLSSDLLSWCVGVAFGRFDWRLATGEREPPPEPDPFDPLPARSPGMLPEGAEPFHVRPGILVDDPGHPHDLAHLVEEVLARVDVSAPDDVRRWLQREFFPSHLQRYSKSRRKAPIYWPLATASGNYTLWVYYPSLGSQTLYTAVNDFVEPRLRLVDGDLAALRAKGSARSRDDERRFESLQTLEAELIELRDTLLKLAPGYTPDQDDGVQISAAPLWPLFRHKPWQKVIKDTWEKLSKGDYDWAHLAMNYWPDRVREKCKTDKSLAIAHGLEDLYVEPEPKPKKTRGRTRA